MQQQEEQVAGRIIRGAGPQALRSAEPEGDDEQKTATAKYQRSFASPGNEGAKRGVAKST
ncbi:hypothetical protein EPA93_28660 [Ktedonosporobacter rubrisoli]|uniref:Uncharacterized protein n=1 Tax=Ktedonosporobacter rubrisoli TaxID=2509675 RepID=A0A4P6JXI4_KTERU|nr:hypothetical protein [Ktedonosporobacter rubrisoli]QBD79736.1 hypothetical protein EPA93_28660 [Ktedonosporobacter rubrisoli]